MPITADTSPGHVFPNGQPFDTDDLNAAANPSVTIDIGSGITGGDVATNTLTMANLKQGPYFFGEAVFASNIYTVTLTPVAAAVTRGMMVYFRADAANTGATDIKLGSLAAVDLLDQHGQEIRAGDIQAGDIIACIAQTNTTGPFRVLGTLNTRTWRYATTAGTANAQTIDYGLNVPSYAAIEGFVISAKIGAALTNTAAMTLAVDGLEGGVGKDVKLPNGGALAAGDVVAGQISLFVYNGSTFTLINPAGFAAYTTTGLVYQNVSTVTNTGLDITAGVQVVYDNTTFSTGEGEPYASLNTSVTPKSATSSLLITVIIAGIESDTVGTFHAGLFMDAETTARAVAGVRIDTTHSAHEIVLRYKMASGSTAAKTFKVRCGSSAVGADWGINGYYSDSGLRTVQTMGATIYSSMTIEEIG